MRSVIYRSCEPDNIRTVNQPPCDRDQTRNTRVTTYTGTIEEEQLTKLDMVARIARQTGVDQQQVKAIVPHTLDQIVDTVATHGRLPRPRRWR